VTALAATDDLSFERRRWTLADGAPSQSFDLAQTSDGLMWLTSPSGLYSFDGVKFKRETEVYGQKILSPTTYAIHALSKGQLALGYSFGGLSIFSPQGARHFIAGKGYPFGSTTSITEDAQGQLYAATTSGVVRLQGDHWLAVAHSKMAPHSIRFDADGTLWALTSDEIFALPQGAADFVSIMKYSGRGYASLFNRRMMVKLADGSMRYLRADGSREPFKLEQPQRYNNVLQGPQGTVVANREGGVARLAQRKDGSWHEVEYYPPVYGDSAGSGSGGTGLSSLRDREGNFWRTTMDGIEKIRLHRFHQVHQQDIFWLAQRGIGDEMWMGGDRKPLLRVRPDGSVQPTDVTGTSALLRAAPDHVWVGTRQGLWEFGASGGQRRELPEAGQRFACRRWRWTATVRCWCRWCGMACGATSAAPGSATRACKARRTQPRSACCAIALARPG
jgi:hypothetical protein